MGEGIKRTPVRPLGIRGSSSLKSTRRERNSVSYFSCTPSIGTAKDDSLPFLSKAVVRGLERRVRTLLHDECDDCRVLTAKVRRIVGASVRTRRVAAEQRRVGKRSMRAELDSELDRFRGPDRGGICREPQRQSGGTSDHAIFSTSLTSSLARTTFQQSHAVGVLNHDGDTDRFE